MGRFFLSLIIAILLLFCLKNFAGEANPQKAATVALHFFTNKTINWTVVDVLGKVVGKGKADNQSQFQINLPHLDKGIYLLLLNDGKLQAKEIIIKTN